MGVAVRNRAPADEITAVLRLGAQRHRIGIARRRGFGAVVGDEAELAPVEAIPERVRAIVRAGGGGIALVALDRAAEHVVHERNIARLSAGDARGHDHAVGPERIAGGIGGARRRNLGRGQHGRVIPGIAVGSRRAARRCAVDAGRARDARHLARGIAIVGDDLGRVAALHRRRDICVSRPPVS